MIRGPGDALRQIGRTEEFSLGDSAIHRLHPGAKLLAALIYLVALLSTGQCPPWRLAPFFLWPVLLCGLTGYPFRRLLAGVLPALPFVLSAGLGSLLAGHPLLVLTLVLRTFLSVSAALLLIATTPFPALTGELSRLHVPRFFAALLEMTYRYLFVLGEEAESMLAAFRLRSGGRDWPAVREYAPVIAQLFLRSVSRAERIYDAMQCRLAADAGLPGHLPARRAWRPADWLYFLLTAASSVLFAAADIPTFLGGLLL